MAAGQNTRSLGRIDPNSLIGDADPNIVSPRATAALTDAFRQGFVTADDIVNRIGVLGKAKKKTELTLNQEAVSPEAVAGRQQAQAASTAQGALAQQQATQEAEMMKLRQRYPGLEDFEKFAPIEGVQPPTLPDGSPDWQKAAQMGSALRLHVLRKETAKTELDSLKYEKTPDGRTVTIDPQGAPVSNDRVVDLKAQSQAAFNQAPGTAIVAPTVTARAPVAPETDEQRSMRVNEMGITTENVLGSFGPPPDVVPRTAATTPAVRPQVSPVASTTRGAADPSGFGYSLGGDADKVADRPTEAQMKAITMIARAAPANEMLETLRLSGFDPTTISSWIDSMFPEVLKSGDRKLYEAATSAWIQGLLRLESGAAIAAKEQAWYEKSFFPQVGDTPEVVNAKQDMRHNLENVVAEQAQSGGVESPETVLNQKSIRAIAQGIATGGASSASNSNPIHTLTSGKRVQRDANGIFQPLD